MMDVYGRGLSETADVDYISKAYQRDLMDIQMIRAMESAYQSQANE
jgi:hypothetical protein